MSYTSFGQNIAGQKIQTLLVVGAVFMMGAWAYYFLTKALGMKEAEYVQRAMNRRTKSKEPVSDMEAGGAEE